MQNPLIEQLKALKGGEVNPRPEWLTTNRAVLLSQISNTVSDQKVTTYRGIRSLGNIWSGLSIYLPRPLVYNVIRPMAILLVVALVVTSGKITAVDASYEAEPGDFSYSVLRAAQKTQLAVVAFIGDKNTETKLHAKFAKSIASKTKKLAQVDTPRKTAKMTVAIADLKSEINSIDSKLEETKKDTAGGKLQAGVAKDVKNTTEQIKDVLQEVKDNLVTGTTTADKLLSQQVSETKDLVKDVSMKAVEVMVVKQKEGDQTISKEEIKQAIGITLQSVATDAVENKQTVDGAKNIISTAQDVVKDLAAEAKKNNNSPSASTIELTAKISTVASATNEAALKSDVAAGEVSKKVSEAQGALAGDDLTKAVDKLKEATEATKEVEKISDATIATAQTVLPMVQVIKDNGSLAASSSIPNVAQIVVSTTLPVVSTSAAVVSSTVTTTIYIIKK